MDWRKVELSGATMLSRVSGEYEVIAPKIPYGGRFKVKVFERVDGSFFATPNVCLKTADGSPDWLGATGRSEAEALENLLGSFMREINSRPSYTVDDFEWSDPTDF